MLPDGYNPLRWNCDKNGCFNVKRRPKIELFADCFPRRCNFGDVDGLVELGGHLGFLEWKGEGGKLHKGQEVTFKRATAERGNIVFVVNGDAETMEIGEFSIFWLGKERIGGFGMAELKAKMVAWALWAESNRKAPCMTGPQRGTR